MNKLSSMLTFRSTILALVYLFNSLVLYIRPIYEILYTGSYYTYIALLLLGLATLSIENFRFSTKSVILYMLIILTAIVDTQFNDLPIGELFPLVWFFVLVYLFSQLSDNELKNPLFLLINRLLWLFLIVYAIVYRDHFFGDMTEEGLLNPNTVGIGIAQFALLDGISGKNGRKSKLIVFIISIIGIWFCDARAALLIYFGVMVFSYILKNKGFKYLAALKFCVAFVIIMGFVLPFIYIQLWHKLGFDAQFLGKNLFTGRERIWDTLFEYMQVHPWSYVWGTGKIEALFWHDNFNLHNGYLAIYAEYGVIVSIMFWCSLLRILYLKLAEIHKMYNSVFPILFSSTLNIDRNAFLYILFTLFIAYTETNYTYILSIIYIAFAYGVLARSEYDDTKGDPLLLVWRK